jgi:hypothetical protein
MKVKRLVVLVLAMIVAWPEGWRLLRHLKAVLELEDSAALVPVLLVGDVDAAARHST